MWSFRWSSNRVHMLLVGICSFLTLVCREWKWIFEPESMYSIMAWRFPVWYFSVSFWVNRCVFPLSGLLRALQILLSYCVSIRIFRYFFLVAIFYSKIVRFLLHPVVGMFSRHLLPIVGRIFFCCFEMSSFVCIVLPFVDIFLILFISSVLSGLFPQLLLSFFLALPFPFCFQCLSFVLSFWLVFVNFLSVFPVEFPILVLIFFFFAFFKGSQFSSKLISLLHLIRLYYSLINKVVLDLFFPFPSSLSSILCFLMMVRSFPRS